MLTPRTNFHHSKLPAIGTIVTVHPVRTSPYMDPPRRKWMVIAYPLNDNHTPDGRPVYSIGIHTVYLKALDNGYQTRCSAIWCTEA